MYYSVQNYSVSVSGSSATVDAELWYVLGNGTVTLKLPYVLSYTLNGSTWWLSGDWWGLANNPGTIVHGVVSYGVTATTSISSNTTSSSTSTSDTTTLTSTATSST